MAIILSIDTATDNATVCLGDETGLLDAVQNKDQKSHAAFVQPAIQQLLKQTQLHIKQIDAIAVTGGPGSYTGLRVGLASAKGLCYTLNKPLIMLDTLETMAKAVIEAYQNTDLLYCPMIDARRMEVFAGVFTSKLVPVIQPNAYLLEEALFSGLIRQQNSEIIFFGSGMEKWKKLGIKGPYIFHEKTALTALALHLLAQQYFRQKTFANIAYCEPNYYKAFYTTAQIKGPN